MKKLAVHEGTVLVPEPMFNAMVKTLQALEAWRTYPAGELNQPEVTRLMLAMFATLDAFHATIADA